jgi:hypothetical protein
MSKYTKGPWTYAGRPGDVHLVECGDWNVARVECESDARLIASAPDLYELALSMESYLTGVPMTAESSSLVDRLNLIKEKIKGGSK